jgi:hypothetical protein
MRGQMIRKILVVLIMLAPVFSYTGCKKQAKCGCDGDVLFSLTKVQAYVYWTSAASITCVSMSDPYSTYNFCNPGEMFPNLKDYKSGDLLLVSGQAFWECNYLYQSSNYSYGSYYKVYMIQVSDVSVDLYGKK